MRMRRYHFLGVMLLAASSCFGAETVLTYSLKLDPADTRLVYPLALMRLAMDKTQDKYGTYKIQPIEMKINSKRALRALKLGDYPNYFILGGVNVELSGAEELLYVDFPVDQGLLSYRVCFVNPAVKSQVAAAQSLNDLKKYTMVSGSNWPDNSILRDNGFQVEEVGIYSSLFKMVISGRVDLFCRGISELKTEFQDFHAMGDLQYDESFVLVYHMPFRFYFNKSNKPLVERLNEGFKIAKEDGSLTKMFWKFNYASVKYANLKTRKVFYLNSGYDKKYSDVYRGYMIDPLALN